MTRDICMSNLSYDIGEEDGTDVIGTPMHVNTDDECSRNDDIHHSDEDELNVEAWEIWVTS